MASTEKWQNWSGFVTAAPQIIARPLTLDQLSDTIRSAPGPIRIAGTGHSFTPLVKSEGTILSLDAFEGLKSHDPQKLEARVGAGTKIGALARLLYGVGQALPNMGDIDKQAFGGGLGTATHGSGATLGAYHTQLEAMQFVDGRGDLREFDRASNPDAMNAMGASLGAFGALTEVTIRNMANYRLRRRRWTTPLPDVLDQFEAMMTAHRSAEFYYIPFAGRALFIASDISDAPATARPLEEDDDGLATLRTLRNFLSWLPWLRRKLIGSAIAKLPDEDYVEDWLKVYASERNVKFNEMEYHLPVEEGAATLREIIALMEGSFPEVYFPVEVRVVAADDVWLSPFYKRPSCSIAIHHDAREDPLPFFSAAEPIFRRHGGRPHWGKMHNLAARELSAIYPRWNDAMAMRREMDPDNRFVSPYMARLLGIEFVSEAYFAELSDALRAASIHQPALVLDLDRLNANIAEIKTRLPKELALRIVDKSLPCLQLLEIVHSAFATERFMTFHLAVSAEVLKKFPSAELLLGKPMPVEGASHALKSGVLAGVEGALPRIVWLIDTDERLAEYGALAGDLGADLRFCFEVDVGLHRGGYRHPDALIRALAVLDQYPGLKCQGVMAYEPQIGRIPRFLGGPAKAQAKATSLLRQFAACLGKDQRAIVNTGGSSTALLYDGWIAANELSVGSAFVLPTDFDVTSLAALQPAAFIATPILKVVDPEMPGLDERTSLLQKLGLFPRRGCFLYGGKWMAEPVHPAGMKSNGTIGFSTNQQFMGLPADSLAKPGDYAFLRPTQSEFVLQQFGTINVYSDGRIVDRWPALPLS